MNLSISNELQLFSKELQQHMSPHALDQLARKVGFVQRKSKYRAQDLVALCVWLSQNIAHTSLTQLCSRLEANTDISMSPEGLNQRFNSRTVQYFSDKKYMLPHSGLKDKIWDDLKFRTEGNIEYGWNPNFGND
ncbi:transposase [Bacillus mycoides FSL H7-687]|nr:transposase [Bacillus mycoides FSL H7-687]